MKLTKDKLQHLACGAIAGCIGAFMLACLFTTIGYLCAFTSGALCGACAGFTAEIKDKLYGNWIDWYDLLATVMGGVVGAAIGALIIVM